MKQVYDRKLIQRLRRRLRLEAAVLVLSVLLTAGILIALYLLRSREFVTVSALASAVVSTLEILFVSAFGVCFFLYDLEYDRFLKRVTARPADNVCGTLIQADGGKYTYKRVTFSVLRFDCGDQYRGGTVLRELYIEQHCDTRLTENRKYRLKVSENSILSYEEVQHEN